MGLDIYAGTLTRYYARNWKNVVQQWAEENDVDCQVMTPDGEYTQTPAEEIQPVVEEWLSALVDGLAEGGTQVLPWIEDNERSYYTNKPNWDAYGALLILSACLHTGEDIPKVYQISSDWGENQAVKNCLMEEVYINSFLNGIELWLPFAESLWFQYVTPTGKEMVMASVGLLEAELQEINNRRWQADEETILSWLTIECEPLANAAEEDAPALYDLETLAKVAFAMFYEAVVFAKENRVPIRLDY